MRIDNAEIIDVQTLFGNMDNKVKYYNGNRYFLNGFML